MWNDDWDGCDIAEMVGRTLASVSGMVAGSDSVTFVADDGTEWRLMHAQDCCESVTLEDVCGDAADLVGSPIVMAEEVSSEPEPEGYEWSEYDSHTWTFYKFATARGSVTLRWLGTSNGYYSESVSFERKGAAS